MKKGSINPHLYRARKGNCLICKKQYRAVSDYKNRKQKYCSKTCWNVRSRKVNQCLFCKKDIITFKSVDKKYCGNKCRNLHYRERLKGEQSHFWQGGKTEQSKIRRTSAEYKEWRMAIFKRDRFKCVWCGTTGKNLEADHILPQSRYPELIFDIKNGRTLCRDCHKKTDTFGNKSHTKKKAKKL